MNGELIARSTKCSDCGCTPNEDHRSFNLRNYEAFPVVYAYLCGVLVRNGDQLELKDGIELGEAPIPRNGYIPPELQKEV